MIIFALGACTITSIHNTVEYIVVIIIFFGTPPVAFSVDIPESIVPNVHIGKAAARQSGKF